MGTRAQFFIGNPVDVENRDWLGCIAFDGSPQGLRLLKDATTAEEFIAAVSSEVATRDDFTDPLQHSFPFPWRDDLFLTDYTYAFFDGRAQVTRFHHGWRDLASLPDDEDWGDEDTLPDCVPAPDSTGPRGPDSIIIMTAQ